MKAAILTTMFAMLLLDVAPGPGPGGCCGGNQVNHSGKEATRSAEGDPGANPPDDRPAPPERPAEDSAGR